MYNASFGSYPIVLLLFGWNNRLCIVLLVVMSLVLCMPFV